MEEEFNIKDSSSFFDFKGFLFKVLSFWPLFLISLAIAYSVAYYINIRKQPIYRLTNLISIKDDQNPLFTDNTSLIFNWGGTTDKVQTNIVLFKSRSHTEKVVSHLQFYISYTTQGKYNRIDVYGQLPFKFEAHDDQDQLYNVDINIKDLGDGRFEFSIPFASNNATLYNYKEHTTTRVNVPYPEYKEVYALGEEINLPFLKGVLTATDITPVPGNDYTLRFGNFNSTVKRYQGISIVQTPRGSSILELSLSGTNKARLVTYLNASVRVRDRDQLERKNLFATNTIKFIDSSLADRNDELKNTLSELNDFKSNNADIILKGGSEAITLKLQDLDLRKDVSEQRLSYYRILEDYLNNRTDYSLVPAPSVAGIDESSIAESVSKIIQLSVTRSNLRYSAKNSNPVFRDLDRQINAEKEVLLENITSSKQIINGEINKLNSEINEAERELRSFPKEEQELANIQRRFSINQEAVTLFLSKKSEATIIKASNVSDILFIDNAKDVGGAQVGPNTRFNYIVAAILGGAIPLAIVFAIVFFNTRIGNIEEIKRISMLPILGIIGKSNYSSNLLLKNHPRSAIAESFRSLRSSLQFIYRKRDIEGTKTVLVTSSISGEGKTFTSINLAMVFALSEKKTLLVGLDLRKPKIFDDFKLTNDVGVVNFLIGDRSLDEIKQSSGVPCLDIILAGPIPPNPSELLISEAMDDFMAQLKTEYDYIILDTPPIGLVTDAFEIMSYADASLYVIRQGYTKKGMLGLINEKYRKGEVNNISLVLNYFRSLGRYGYGYGYDYGYGAYGNGYHQDGKRPNILIRLRRRLKYLFKK